MLTPLRVPSNPIKGLGQNHPNSSPPAQPHPCPSPATPANSPWWQPPPRAPSNATSIRPTNLPPPQKIHPCRHDKPDRTSQAGSQVNQTLWQHHPPCAPNPWTHDAPEHWQNRELQEYWQTMMDSKLKFVGPSGGQWTSLGSWTCMESIIYSNWKCTVNARLADAIRLRVSEIQEYCLQIYDAVRRLFELKKSGYRMKLWMPCGSRKYFVRTQPCKNFVVEITQHGLLTINTKR